jgi:hypothetical protein
MKGVSKSTSWSWIDAALLGSILVIAAVVLSILASGSLR